MNGYITNGKYRNRPKYVQKFGKQRINRGLEDKRKTAFLNSKTLLNREANEKSLEILKEVGSEWGPYSLSFYS